MWLHIGFHKAASAFLQRRLFPRLTGIDYVTGPERTEAQRLILEHFASPSKEIQVTLPAGALLSSERLIGHPSNGFRDWEHRLDVLSDLFPAAAIIIVFRRQDAALESMFKHAMAKKKYPGTMEEYIGLKASTVATVQRESLSRATDYRAWDYVPIIAGYQERFGFKKVLALPFEMLAESPTAFCRAITDFIGVPLPAIDYAAVNTGLSKVGYHYHSVRHRLGLSRFTFKPIERMASRVSGPAAPMSKKMHEIILAHHRASNERLSQIVERDLRRYGYA
jgi:hypothetical protein